MQSLSLFPSSYHSRRAYSEYKNNCLFWSSETLLKSFTFPNLSSFKYLQSHLMSFEVLGIWRAFSSYNQNGLHLVAKTKYGLTMFSASTEITNGFFQISNPTIWNTANLTNIPNPSTSLTSHLHFPQCPIEDKQLSQGLHHLIQLHTWNLSDNCIKSFIQMIYAENNSFFAGLTVPLSFRKASHW